MLRIAARTRPAAAAAVRAAPRRALSTAADAAAVTAYRRFGHLQAQTDPLGLAVRTSEEVAAAAAAAPNVAARLDAVYCGALGAEFEHLDSAAEREWWAAQLEQQVPSFELSLAQRKNFFTLLTQAEQFELFLGRKFTSLKRYSGEGTESLLPALNELLSAAADHGVRDVVIGQAHRGRLGLLCTLLNYPARKLLWKIMGNDDFPASVQGLDDVSSHVAASADRVYPGGKLHVSLLHNPSHLEYVNPVAAGKTRAKQDQGSPDALCLLIHGDAAVSGQGIVAETYAMSNLPGYTVGGTVHVITNNQVGFTAEGASAGRSSRYASDMAKVVGAPVLHVNAEAPREVALAVRLAVAYRAAFRKDVVVDLIGYRKHGHNELDEPSFTSPVMYEAIRSRASFPARYAAALEAEGVLPPGQREAVISKLTAHLEAEYAAAAGFTKASGSMGLPPAGASAAAPPPTGLVVGDGSSFAGKWLGVAQASIADLRTSPPTGVDAESLRRVGAASVATPPGLRMHDRLVRSHVHPRRAALGLDPATGAPVPGWNPATAPAAIDWATAEALAFGSLLEAGHDVRLSGQDSQRGTFSHRHAVLVDQATGERFTPLGANLQAPGAGRFEPVSSLLSELAVLGFELGYSWESPRPLVLWEAQFGDFVNCAQPLFDTFVASTETKWLRQTGLVMLLPHGFDGAGPEHSSARVERFLQLCNSNAVARPGAAGWDAGDKALTESSNLLVVNPTTPANYFHVLRRQVARGFRKPLVVVAPKTLIRHPQAVSTLAELGPGTAFQPVLPDVLAPAGAAAGDVKRVLLTSGKLYFELAKRRADVGRADTAVLRVEELSPFPTDAIVSAIRASYPAAASVAWVQEEPANAGAWAWAEAHLSPALAAAGLPHMTYIGRPALAAPAVGLSKYNKAQQDALLAAAVPK